MPIKHYPSIVKIEHTTESLSLCHISKKVRGLLCTNCNLGIGYFKDDTDLLSKAIQYVKDHK